MKKQLSVLLALMVVVAVLLAGCGTTSKGHTPPAPEQQAQGEGNTQKGGPITLDWYYFSLFAQHYPAGQEPPLLREYAAGQYKSYEQYVANRFEAAHPGVQVRLHALDFTQGPQVLKHALAAGHCDVLQDAPGRILSYAYEGKLLPLDEFFTSDYQADLVNLALLGACRSQEHYYMYPLSNSPFHMAFNKKAAEEAGILPLLKEDWTIEEFAQALRTMRLAGYVGGSVFCQGSGGDQATRAFVANLAGTRVLNADRTQYTLLTGAGEEALSFIQNRVAEGSLGNGMLLNGSMDIENFVHGRTMFTILWSGAQQADCAADLAMRNIEVLALPFPHRQGKQVELEYMVNGYAVVKTGNEARQQAAKEFVRFMCDDPEVGRMNVQASGCLPVRRSFEDVLYTEQQRRAAGWERYYAPYYNNIPGFANMRVLWYRTLQALLSGSRSASQASAYFTSEANRVLAEARAASAQAESQRKAAAP